jgi:hypothetical protein
MRTVEREMQDIVAKRMASANKAPGRFENLDIIRRAEDFAIDNMRNLALGAAGAILGLATIMASSGPALQPASIDPVIVGSITPAARVPSQQNWQVVRKPTELVALQAPQFERQPMLYQARVNPQGDREDALIWQGAAANLPEAQVTITRRVNGGMAPSLFIDMTRQQAERGIAVTRAGMPGLLPTKFGDVEVADMGFTDEANRSQACLAFRTSLKTSTIGLSGWFCAAQTAVIERPELSCFIDRLALIKSGEDKDLRRFFTEAEQRRRPCPTTRVSSSRKPTWLDADGKAPPLRTPDITGSIGDKPKR